MEDPQEAVDLSKPQKRQRRSSSRSVFPRLPLQKVIPLLEAIWEEGHGEQVRTTAAFAELGRSHTSGPSRTLIAAANTGYGLISGNANSTYLGLTPKGQSIVDSKSNAERLAVIHSALFENEIFRRLHTRYLDKALPSDQVVSDYIKSEFGLSDEDSVICWSIVSENLRDSGLLVREGNRDVVLAVDNVHEATSPTMASAPASGLNPDPIESISANPETMKEDATLKPSQAEFHFNIQIHIPNDSTPEVYDAIFASIARNLLNRME